MSRVLAIAPLPPPLRQQATITPPLLQPSPCGAFTTPTPAALYRAGLRPLTTASAATAADATAPSIPAPLAAANHDASSPIPAPNATCSTRHRCYQHQQPKPPRRCHHCPPLEEPIAIPV
ncbi:lysine-rich arabinogalactan protein 19-like [Eucalyptus grandis]|uniref:lysine-rich arabinogalactan protein 19-like n=1 Tax=Eucalyptus grandis TaxID=71139 RepID=UPI00192F07BB|nr:lysine-rich arabinogalactan protein 19-like [Eucalyptus grandis]